MFNCCCGIFFFIDRKFYKKHFNAYMVSKIVYVVSFVIYHLFVLCIYTKGEIIFDIFEAFKYLNILIFGSFSIQLWEELCQSRIWRGSLMKMALIKSSFFSVLTSKLGLIMISRFWAHPFHLVKILFLPQQCLKSFCKTFSRNSNFSDW